MPRINIYMRKTVNNSSVIALPPVEFKLPRATSARVELLLSELGMDKEPVDLTGCDVAFVVRRRKYPVVGGDDIVMVKNTADGITLDLSQPGHADLHITAEDLELAPTTYWYEISIVDGDSIYRQVYGRFTLLP